MNWMSILAMVLIFSSCSKETLSPTQNKINIIQYEDLLIGHNNGVFDLFKGNATAPTVLLNLDGTVSP